MLRFLWSGATGRDVIQLSYILWTRISAMTVVIWAALSGENSWVATIGLGAVLVLLLLGGVVLLVLGVRDLVRDVRHYLHDARSDKNQHASV